MVCVSDNDFFRICECYDILILSETWISKTTSLNLGINGYFCEYLFGTKSPVSTKGRYSGGLSIFAKHYLKDKLEIIEKTQMAYYG